MDEGESIILHKNIYLIFHNTTYNDFYFQSFIVCNRKVNEFFFFLFHRVRKWVTDKTLKFHCIKHISFKSEMR